MSNLEYLISDYSDLIGEHCTWLKHFGKHRLKRWEDFLKSNPEGAICECLTQKMLSEHGVKVEPYEDLSSGGPDFKCTKHNKCFYIETTCISIKAATRESGLNPSYSPDHEDDAMRDMTEKFRSEIAGKTKQCSSSRVEAPCVVVIATLHSQASDWFFDDFAAEQLLTGTTRITGKVKIGSGKKVGNTYESTRLEGAAFIKPQKDSPNWIEYARAPVSAVLLCGFGSIPPNLVGCLHPNPNYPFDRKLLHNIKFCRLAETDPLKVEWI